jgi:GAF domain-containing protein
LSQTTFRPTPEDHLSRLSRQAEELRGQLKNLDGALRQSGNSVPAGLLTGLRQMSVILEELRETFSTSEVERRNLQALAEINQVINSSLDLNTVLNEVIDTIIRLTGAERAFLMLRNERGELEIKTARNWERESVGTGDVEISRTIIDRVLAQGEAILTTNATEDPRFGGQQSVVAYNLRSILCVPLKVKGQLTGVIYSDNKARAALFSPRERDLLTSFAHQAAVAIENARLFASVQATLAEVTDLKNLMDDVFASIARGDHLDIMDKITLCNRAAERILAIPSSQLIGSSLGDLLPKLADDLPEKVSQVKQRDLRVIDLEVRPGLAGRGSVALSLNLTPLKTAEEATRGVAMVMDDLTDRRRLEAQRRLFELMVSPAVIDQLDPDRLQLGGQLREITTLFADIRGFTSFSEEIDPVSWSRCSTNTWPGPPRRSWSRKAPSTSSRAMPSWPV